VTGRMAAEGVLDIDEFVIPRVFIAIAVIIVVARLMGMLFKKIRQPAVVGEIVGGILMGPTLLGQGFLGNVSQDLFPTEIRPFLKVVANLGLIIFMFIVGLELDLKLIKGKERKAGVISFSSIVLPFGLGLILALYLHDRHDLVIRDGEEFMPTFLAFAMFIGASMSVTAFPVLARILTDRGMYRTEIGALTLACAAVDDILAWTLLAIVLAIVDTGSISTHFLEVMGWSIAFVAVMFLVVKPLLARMAVVYKKAGKLTPNVMAIILIGILAASFTTSKIGIHHIFGAFTFGAVMPRNDTHDLFHEILERLENVSVLLLLPVFFVATGLNVSFDGLHASSLGTLGLILLTACAGKFIGATVGARTQRIPMRKAAAIGTLMNTRGLTELIILGIGREKGVLDDELFTLLVVMAVFTTVITEPVLRLFYPDRLLARDVAEAERLALGIAVAYRVLVPVNDPGRAEHLVDVACDLIGDEDPAEIVLSRLSAQSSAIELGSGLGNPLADIAASMDALNGLQRRAEARGVRCVAINQRSGDPVRDWIQQVETLDCDVVVVDAGDGPADLVSRMLADAEGDVVVVHDPVGLGLVTLFGDGAVVVAMGEGLHGAAAVELGVRAARSRERGLTLVDTSDDARRNRRRAGQVSEQVERIGVSVTVAGADDTESGSAAAISVHGPDAGLIVIAHGPGAEAVVAAAARAVCVVRAKDGFERPKLVDVFKDRPNRAENSEGSQNGPIIVGTPTEGERP
jgi:Kef-type K+ transport system membrane component KefB